MKLQLVTLAVRRSKPTRCFWLGYAQAFYLSSVVQFIRIFVLACAVTLKQKCPQRRGQIDNTLTIILCWMLMLAEMLTLLHHPHTDRRLLYERINARSHYANPRYGSASVPRRFACPNSYPESCTVNRCISVPNVVFNSVW